MVSSLVRFPLERLRDALRSSMLLELAAIVGPILSAFLAGSGARLLEQRAARRRGEAIAALPPGRILDARPRMLLVDDEVYAGFAVKRLAAEHGIAVDTPEDARQFVATRGYRLMLVDVRLGGGGVDGLTLVEELRPRIVIWTGDPGGVQRAEALGMADAVLEKTAAPDSLDVLERVLLEHTRR